MLASPLIALPDTLFIAVAKLPIILFAFAILTT
jgi:hypothetical protein